MSASEKIVCPRCGTANPAGFNFCGNCGLSLRSPVGGDGAEPRAAERRRITVMFCDLVGSVALSLNLDPEDLRDVVRRYQHECVGVIERYEGYVAQYLGDGVLAYFGYPVVHDGEAERAVRAGLDILHRIESLSAELKLQYGIEMAVRIGIHTGLVVIGEIGSGDHKEHLALGETPNLAARLQSVAPHNGLVVSEATHRLIGNVFESVDLGPQSLKGLAREEHVFRIVRERLAASPLDLVGISGPISTMGRENEVQQFRDVWQEVEGGRGGVLLVRGEPGIGKSHVVQLFRQEVDAFRHFRVECRCSPYLRSSAFHPLIDWLHRILNFYPEQPADERFEMIEFVVRQNGLDPTEAPRLLASLLSLEVPEHYRDPGYSAARRKVRTEEVLRQLMVSMVADRPLLFILEDVQWLDPSTRGFLEHFAESIADRPVLLLLTSRVRDTIKWPEGLAVRELLLDRLSREQVQWVMEDVARGKLIPPAIVDQIHAKTDGVPLFVQEFTKMVIEAGMLVECEDCFQLVEDLPDLAIPATLHDSLMARLDRLHPVKEVAQLCSVLGREFTFELARVTSEMSDAALADALDQLVASDLLIAEGRPPRSRYMFRHALIQEAAYESILRSRRTDYHRRLATYLIELPESGGVRPEIIAHHLTRAGDLDRAVDFWRRAGELAQERWANEEAVDYFTRGKALLDRLTDAPDRRRQAFFINAGLAVASLQIRGYTHPSVLVAFERAAELADYIDDPDLSAPVIRGIWAHLSVLADHRRAEGLAKQLTLIAARSSDPLQRVQASAAHASTLLWRGRVAESRTILEDVVAGLSETRTMPPPALAFQHPYVGALSYLGFALWYLGYPEQALERSTEARDCAESMAHPFSKAFAFGFDSAIKAYMGLWDASRESAEEAYRVSSMYDFPFWLNLSRVVLARAEADADPTKAIDAMQAGLGNLERNGVRIWTAYPTALLGELLGAAGRREEGLRLLDGVISRNQESGELFLLPEVYRIRARLLDALERPNEAQSARLRALQLAREQEARSIIVRILLDIVDYEPSPSPELQELLRTTTESFTEGFEGPELVAARAHLTPS